MFLSLIVKLLCVFTSSIRKELNWKNIKDVKFVSAMGRPGGARNHVDPRFISLFCTFEIQFPAAASLFHIYNCILEAHVQNLGAEVKVILSSSKEFLLP